LQKRTSAVVKERDAPWQKRDKQACATCATWLLPREELRHDIQLHDERKSFLQHRHALHETFLCARQEIALPVPAYFILQGRCLNFFTEAVQCGNQDMTQE
jgi:hypothetical protein